MYKIEEFYKEQYIEYRDFVEQINEWLEDNQGKIKPIGITSAREDEIEKVLILYEVI